jgi:hypothetical protein
MVSYNITYVIIFLLSRNAAWVIASIVGDAPGTLRIVLINQPIDRMHFKDLLTKAPLHLVYLE